jgi:predicted heme/steroid binding protein
MKAFDVWKRILWQPMKHPLGASPGTGLFEDADSEHRAANEVFRTFTAVAGAFAAEAAASLSCVKGSMPMVQDRGWQ